MMNMKSLIETKGNVTFVELISITDSIIIHVGIHLFAHGYDM